MYVVTLRDRFDAKWKEPVINCTTFELAEGSAKRALERWKTDGERFETVKQSDRVHLVELVDIYDDHESSDTFAVIKAVQS